MADQKQRLTEPRPPLQLLTAKGALGFALAFVVDAIFVGLPGFGFGVSVLVALGSALNAAMVRKTDRPLFIERRATVFMATATALAIVGACLFNIVWANHQGERVVEAIRSYHEAEEHYPDNLEELTPDHLSWIPPAALRLSYNSFEYQIHEGEHSLWWRTLPPFGRRGYLFEEGRWYTLD